MCDVKINFENLSHFFIRQSWLKSVTLFISIKSLMPPVSCLLTNFLGFGKNLRDHRSCCRSSLAIICCPCRQLDIYIEGIEFHRLSNSCCTLSYHIRRCRNHAHCLLCDCSKCNLSNRLASLLSLYYFSIQIIFLIN